jgi:hypothetical protein
MPTSRLPLSSIALDSVTFTDNDGNIGHRDRLCYSVVINLHYHNYDSTAHGIAGEISMDLWHFGKRPPATNYIQVGHAIEDEMTMSYHL